jgi:hypothetical protein
VKLIMGTYVKTCRENPGLVKIGPKYLAFYKTPYLRVIFAGDEN